MKTIIFLLLFFCLAFACDGKDDIFLTRSGDSIEMILTHCGGDEYTVGMFNSEYPQYSKNPKKIFCFENVDENSAINKLKENNLYDFMSAYPADFKWLRLLVVIEI
jgi:hypothetical protein